MKIQQSVVKMSADDANVSLDCRVIECLHGIMLHLKFQIIGVANCYQVADNEQASRGRVPVQEYRRQTRRFQLANTGEEGKANLRNR